MRSFVRNALVQVRLSICSVQFAANLSLNACGIVPDIDLFVFQNALTLAANHALNNATTALSPKSANSCISQLPLFSHNDITTHDHGPCKYFRILTLNSDDLKVSTKSTHHIQLTWETSGILIH